MKSLAALTPRAAVPDGTADFIVNLAEVNTLTEADAREFLDSNVLTSGMEFLPAQAFTRMAAILGYLREVTEANPHWGPYQNLLAQLAIAVEHYRG